MNFKLAIKKTDNNKVIYSIIWLQSEFNSFSSDHEQLGKCHENSITRNIVLMFYNS